MQFLWGCGCLSYLLIHSVFEVRNGSSQHSHGTDLFSTHPFQHPQLHCAFLYHLPPFFTSNPFLITPPSVAPRLPEASFAEGSQHPPSLKKNTPVPACQPSSGWKPSGLLWGMGEFTPPPCVSFPSIPPQGHGASLPPLPIPSCFPGQVHPGHPTARGQSATFQWLHTTTGRAPDSFVGGGGRAREAGVKSSPGANSAHWARRRSGHNTMGARWASGAPRTPSTVEKDKISNLCG